MKKITNCFVLIIFTLSTHAQLLAHEKMGIIYDTRPQFFQASKMRLDGKQMKWREISNILKNDTRSASLFKQGQTLTTIGSLTNLAGLGGMWVGAIRLNRNELGIRRYNVNQSVGLFAGGTLLIMVGGVIENKGSLALRNAINRYNKETELAKPSKQYDTMLANKKITLHPTLLGANIFYHNGTKITARQLDELLKNNSAAQPFYIPLQKNVKVQRIAGYATLVSSAAAIILVSTSNLNNPTKSVEAIGSATAISFLGSFFTYSFASSTVRRFRYNGYRAFNGETMYPYNRRHERMITATNPTVSLGMGNYGYGIVVRL